MQLKTAQKVIERYIEGPARKREARRALKSAFDRVLETSRNESIFFPGPDVKGNAQKLRADIVFCFGKPTIRFALVPKSRNDGDVESCIAQDCVLG